jgi:hypothetical protein
VASWQAFGGDLGGVQPFVELFDSYGNLYMFGVQITNTFAQLSKFNVGQFTASATGINIKNTPVVTNLVSKTTLSTDGSLSVGSDTYTEGNLAPLNTPWVVQADVQADSFIGSGASLTGIPGTAVEGGWTVSKVTGSDATTTGQSLVDVTGLTYVAAANSTYEFESVLYCTTTAVTTGTEYGLANTGAGSGVTTFFIATGATNAATGATYYVSATNSATQPFLLASSQTGVVVLKGFFVTLGGTPTIAVRHLKVTSGTSTVKQGSDLKVRKLF